MKLFRLITLPYWRRRALKMFLTVLGMASGIAVYTAIDLSNRSALRSFEESVRRVGGDADLAVVGRERKVADADYAAVLRLPGTRAATPLLEAQGLCGPETKHSFTLLGVDPLSRGAFFSGGDAAGDARPWLELMAEPGTALVPATLAARCGIRDGEAFTVLLRGRPVALRARLGGGGDPAFADSGLIFADVATAQEALGELG
ncbi:MAG: ABC transporter permease, partial [Deltaproteobacteria bacterium]|nr:ABC transporter permease [Deltaproteobacteria bacterium]